MSGFGIEHLPYGVIRRRAGGEPHAAVRFDDAALDLTAIALPVERDVFAQPTLNAFCALGPDAWAATRAAIQSHLRDASPRLIPLDDVETLLPFDIGDFVDFYSSLQHATNLGRIVRPDAEPLLPNWRHLPVAYHGRSGTIVVSGTPVRRPRGLVPDADGVPALHPTAALDIELEVGFVVGVGNEGGHPIRPDDADKHVFGLALVNDWSARDIQAFEYQPLGPFLGKSFATTIAAWITPLEALREFLVDPPVQEPQPDPYLRAQRAWGLDLDLAVDLNGTTVTRTNFSHLYWTFAQQLAHITINGATTRPGDLFASGTVSGPAPGGYGSLIELTWRGRDPIRLSDGSERTFLEDGDTVTLRGAAGSITLAECAGTIQPA